MSEAPPVMPSRNDVLGFAARTRKNLEYIECAYGNEEDVHVVTQLAVSLLGLIVFPWEKNFEARVKSLPLDDLVSEGWPQWNIYQGSSETLGDHVRHLRNAVAHGRMTFSSDDRDVSEISIDVADCRPGSSVPYWRASISAVELREFCLRFIRLLEDTVG